MKRELDTMIPVIRDYHITMKQLKPMRSQLAALKKDLDDCSALQLVRKAQLQKQITDLQRAMEPYIISHQHLLKALGCKSDKAVGELEKKLDSMRKSIALAEHHAHMLDSQHDGQMDQHMTLMNRITSGNISAVDAERNAIRQQEFDAMQQKLYDTYGNMIDQAMMKHAVKITDATIHKRKNTHNREYSASLEAERI